MLKRTVAILTLALAFGCAESPTEAPIETGPWTLDLADGATLTYEVEGVGQPTVVLVHGWMAERSLWARQLPELTAKHRVVTVDLPGHGDGSDARSEWSVAGLGDDLAALLDELDLRDAVLVGHSMGGAVSLHAAAKAPERVAGIVAVDALHDAEFRYSEEIVGQMVAILERDFGAACLAMIDRMFIEPDGALLRDEVAFKSCEEGNAEAGIALMADFTSVDLGALMREAGVPIRAINAADGNATTIEKNRGYADFDAVLMPGVGHFLFMTRPEPFNLHLLAAIDELKAIAN